jgi:multicomponent Na+:H+ antiporter subunit C
MIVNIPLLAVASLVIIGLYAVMFRRNIIKIIIGITLIESGVNLFLVTLSYRTGSIAPIYSSSSDATMAYPVPQALTIVSIVIGFAVLALMLSLAIHIYRHYKTLDVRKLGGSDK